MNPRRCIPVVALLLAVAGCDFKETRSGTITLTAGSAGIPLNGKAGAATLVIFNRHDGNGSQLCLETIFANQIYLHDAAQSTMGKFL